MDKKAYILRRRKLGRTSCKNIRKQSKYIMRGKINDQKIYPDPDLICIRWGCNSKVPQRIVFNSVEAIAEVNDKKAFRLLLAEHKLAPKSWGSYNVWSADGEPLPIIIRPAQHAQGKNIQHFDDQVDPLIKDICRKWVNYYISEYIDKVAEYRVFVAQGRAVWVAKKTPGDPKAIAWNVARGGRFDNVAFSDWPLKAVKTSIEAFNLSKLDFGGVDVMVDAKGNCYVLEINSAPSQTSPYRQSCVAKAFDYMIEKGKDRIGLVEEKGGYLKFIHPAIDEKAKLP